MPAPKNLIHETSATIGAGDLATSLVNGKVRFSDSTYGFGTGSTANAFDYFISNRDMPEWERGTGHCSAAGVLVRDTVIESSNGNALVVFSAGVKDVTNAVPAGSLLISSTVAALTKTDDTNVTLTLGGSPSTALIAAASITVSWSGTLAAGRGGFGADISASTGVPLFATGTATFTSTSGTGNFVRVSNATLIAPVLGTPASGVATNLTGTAAGLTAGNVTTNANLTGPITSVGNATSIASQTGTGSTFVVQTSPALVTPDLGTPSAGVLTNATGLPISTGVAGLGTNAATALGVNIGSAGAVVVNGGVLGTPSSGTLTNATGLPVASGISGLGTGVATFLATPSSANLAAAITDETGTGNVVLSASPTLTGTITAAAANFSGTITFGTGTVTALSADATPDATADYLLTYDASAIGFKKALISSVVGSAAAGVTSIASNTGAFTLANGIDNSTNQIQLTAARRTLPTRQVFASGSSTYTTPANCLWIEVELIGGGGGGGGSGTGSAGNGASGSDTTFGAFTANKGVGTNSSGLGAGAGGAAPTFSGTTYGFAGATGGAAETSIVGVTLLGGLGGGSAVDGSVHNGAGVTNSGAGGSGASISNAGNPGAGGGGGAYVNTIITSPGATYSYGIGTGGAGGSAGTAGNAGFAGASGIIKVTEHYGS